MRRMTKGQVLRDAAFGTTRALVIVVCGGRDDAATAPAQAVESHARKASGAN